jgi:hypothetical protein
MILCLSQQNSIPFGIKDGHLTSCRASSAVKSRDDIHAYTAAAMAIVANKAMKGLAIETD